MFVLATLAITLLFVIYEFLIWRFDFFEKLGLPAPKPRVLLGNLPNLLLGKRHIIYDYDAVYKQYKGQQTITGVFALRCPQFLVCSPEAVKEVMVKQFKNFGENDFNMIDNTADPIFGRNPFLLAGAEWKEKRAEITPAMTPGRLRAVYPLIEDVCNRLVDYVHRQRAGVDIQLKELAAKYTTDVVSSCLYSVNAESFTKENPVIREMGRRMMNFPPLFNLYVMALAIVPKLKDFYKMRMVSPDIEQFFTSLMNDAMEMRKNSKSDRQDFLEFLVQLKERKNLSPLDMAAHSVTFFLDGFETSSVFISYVLYELSVNKDIQVRLREEIKEVESNKGLTFDSIAEMPYLEQVCCEALRLHPPLVIMGKRCSEDTEIEIANGKRVAIKKGATVIVPVLSIHTDPEIYPNPDVFDPERFSVDNGGSKQYKDNSSFLGFGDGPRICLGMKFALAQSKAAIIALVRDFEIHPSTKVQTPLVIHPKELMNVPTGGLWAKFTPISP